MNEKPQRDLDRPALQTSRNSSPTAIDRSPGCLAQQGDMETPKEDDPPEDVITPAISLESSISADNPRAAFAADVPARLEAMVAEVREKMEQQYEAKVQNIIEATKVNRMELKSTKKDLEELSTRMARLVCETEEQRSRRSDLENTIKAAEQRAELAVKEKKATIASLEQKLSIAKSEMSKNANNYQDLMKVKTSLESNISSYKKLLLDPKILPNKADNEGPTS
uniref:keratin, type II cytoskeletal 7-like n=1 Tax=Myxine glutinosa TaxID=7769 RepID=UPI00358E5A1D